MRFLSRNALSHRLFESFSYEIVEANITAIGGLRVIVGGVGSNAKSGWRFIEERGREL